MTDYRAGQRIRIDGPEDVVIEATVEEFNGHPRVTIPGMGVIRLDVDGRERWGSTYGCTVTVLSEPRPDEPTGLGAVVEDAVGGFWVRADEGHLCWREVLPGTYHEDDATRRHWGQIKVVRVLSEGWTP